MRATGTWLAEDLAARDDGAIALLARERSAYVVLTGGGASGPGRVVFSDSSVALSRLVNGRGNALWLGGRVNPHADVARTDAADAYLTRIDHSGAPAGEYVFRSGRYRTIEDLYALPGGDLLVSGRDGNETWLARISENGALRWQQRFGIAKASAIGMIDARIVVAAFDAPASESKRYREELAVWTFEADGKPGARHVLTPVFTETPSSRAKLSIAAGAGATYVISSSTDSNGPRVVDVSRLAPDGSSMGHVALTETLIRQDNRTFATCDPTQVVLETGDLLVACVMQNRIRVYRLAGSNAEVTALSAPLPNCQRNIRPSLFLTRGPKGALWLLGSWPGGSLGAGCTWLGALALE